MQDPLLTQRLQQCSPRLSKNPPAGRTAELGSAAVSEVLTERLVCGGTILTLSKISWVQSLPLLMCAVVGDR